MIHHIALATKDIRKAHHFYTVVMGFKLVKAVKRKAPEGGWTKHVFYDMGCGRLFAVWDLRGLEGVCLEPSQWKSAMSSGMGLPRWINHIAFECSGPEEFARCKQRWLDNGYHVAEVDHDFIRSAYTYDPDGTLVEWTYKTRPLTDEDRIEAEGILSDDSPAVIGDYQGPFIRSTAKKFEPNPAALPPVQQ